MTHVVATGEAIKKLRMRKGMSQPRLAAEAGLHPTTVIAAEQGFVTWRTAKRLGDVLGMDPRELVTRE